MQTLITKGRSTRCQGHSGEHARQSTTWQLRRNAHRSTPGRRSLATAARGAHITEVAGLKGCRSGCRLPAAEAVAPQVTPRPDRSLRLQVEGALTGRRLHGESEDEADAYQDSMAATGS